ASGVLIINRLELPFLSILRSNGYMRPSRRQNAPANDTQENPNINIQVLLAYVINISGSGSRDPKLD
ncbi:MAG: hypothetical protein MHPSP_004083, partial [Paramarteilia canceri]